MLINLNHYELLEVSLDASTDDIKKAYNEKIINCKSELMEERFKTAYYILSDTNRRQKYDLSLGIHKYKIVPKYLRVLKALARMILTLLDMILTFYWCFLITVILFTIGYNIYLYFDKGIVFSLSGFLCAHKEEIIILGGFAGIDLLTHFYVRRANRFLKHYNWEYIEKEDKYK